MMTRFKIHVPASSGNVGPGFDSMGLAVNMYLTLEVTPDEQWTFISPSTEEGMNPEEHFIYKVAKRIADKHSKSLTPCRVEETSSIPLARGLGSSASAIIAGIEIANQLCDLNLSNEEKLAYATEIEGHPDNAAPALFGGLVISTLIDDEIDWIKIDNLDFGIVAFIPEVELKTDDSRNVLPEAYEISEAALASGISNLTVAALLTSDYKLAGKMMENDRFHEPYRKSLIPNYDRIKSFAKEADAYGAIISGAGPTMLSFVAKDNQDPFVQKAKQAFPDYRIEALQVDAKGLQVEVL